MKRVSNSPQNDEVEYDWQSSRKRCRFKLLGCSTSNTKDVSDGPGLHINNTEEYSESDARDSDTDEAVIENGHVVGGIMSSRVCKSRIPRWRMRKFLFISFNDEERFPDFLGCPEWAKPMLAVYYQARRSNGLPPPHSSAYQPPPFPAFVRHYRTIVTTRYS
jgi:hypothetical protein